jgi:catechol 2,3-dioxygenase-like lactoylglutathione lyase family enzyme
VRLPDLSLVVLRTRDVDRTRALYEGLGLKFVEEQHATGPAHLSATLASGLVIEIYPTRQAQGVETTRLGFVVENLDAALLAASTAGAEVVSRDGRTSAVIEDLDGRRVELHTRTT